mgnify:CR=1 FL=1
MFQLLYVLATLCHLPVSPRHETNVVIRLKLRLVGATNQVRKVNDGAYSGGSKPVIRCVRKGDWKLIRYHSPDKGIDETQLFNLAENPHELLIEHHDPSVIALTGNTPTANQVNLADDPAYADKLKEMEALHYRAQWLLDDPHLLARQPPLHVIPPLTTSNAVAVAKGFRQKFYEKDEPSLLPPPIEPANRTTL